MCEKCDALQERCNSLADWGEKRGLSQVSEEDVELISFFLAKSARNVGGGAAVMTMDSMMSVCSCVYLAGYKKGFEVSSLESLTK